MKIQEIEEIDKKLSNEIKTNPYFAKSKTYLLWIEYIKENYLPKHQEKQKKFRDIYIENALSDKNGAVIFADNRFGFAFNKEALKVVLEAENAITDDFLASSIESIPKAVKDFLEKDLTKE